jgi:large subunit ribosomal protein L16
MLQPARTKYRKQQKGRNTGIATRGNKVAFGEYGLKALGRGRLTARQLEAARRTLSRHIKRGGRVWIRVFPDKPISRKPAEVRMGNGKGNPEYFVCEIQPGKIIFEMDGVDAALAKEAFALAAAKLPFRTASVHRLLGEGNPSMKASELRAKSGDDLQKELNELLKAQFGLRMQHATQQLANTSQIKKVRRDIARVRTVIKEKAAK